MLKALEELPEKRLIAFELENDSGDVCAIGAVGKARGLDMKDLDPNDSETVAKAFNIAPALAREIVYENDEGAWYGCEDEEARFLRIKAWVETYLHKDNPRQDC